VFRSRADKASASNLARAENSLKYEQKYKDLLTITNQEVKNEIRKFENTNKDVLERIDQRMDELYKQALVNPFTGA
jgi:vacuolar-type H+-ATPase subunit D/Vma8